jgi:hypothetical protein
MDPRRTSSETAYRLGYRTAGKENVVLENRRNHLYQKASNATVPYWKCINRSVCTWRIYHYHPPFFKIPFKMKNELVEVHTINSPNVRTLSTKHLETRDHHI